MACATPQGWPARLGVTDNPDLLTFEEVDDLQLLTRSGYHWEPDIQKLCVTLKAAWKERDELRLEFDYYHEGWQVLEAELKAENTRLREALQWYADLHSSDWGVRVPAKLGERAREALGK
jgi:hypothetical protein